MIFGLSKWQGKKKFDRLCTVWLPCNMPWIRAKTFHPWRYTQSKCSVPCVACCLKGDLLCAYVLCPSGYAMKQKFMWPWGCGEWCPHARFILVIVAFLIFLNPWFRHDNLQRDMSSKCEMLRSICVLTDPQTCIIAHWFIAFLGLKSSDTS